MAGINASDINTNWWVQGGIARRRSWDNPPPPLSTTIDVVSYAEMQDSRQTMAGWTITFSSTPASSSGEYRVNWSALSPRHAEWTVDGNRRRFVDDVGALTFMPFEQAVACVWQGETPHTGDRMAGTANNHCKFRECQMATGHLGGFFAVEFIAEDFTNVPPYLFGLNQVGPDGFDIWDLWP